MRTPRPVNMVSDALFAPADGLLYTEEDRDRAFSQQPLKALPEPYLIPDKTCNLKPPVLHYGWKIGYDKMMAIVTERLPHMVQIRAGPDTWDDVDGSGWSDNIPDEEWNRMQPSPSATLYNRELRVAICRHLGIPEKVAHYITVHEFEDANGCDAGLSIGTNYAGFLKELHCAKLQMMFSPNEEPKWYLDETMWQWRREALAQKSSRKRPAA